MLMWMAAASIALGLNITAGAGGGGAGQGGSHARLGLRYTGQGACSAIASAAIERDGCSCPPHPSGTRLALHVP
jgi:hypothetical protein